VKFAARTPKAPLLILVAKDCSERSSRRQGVLSRPPQIIEGLVFDRCLRRPNTSRAGHSSPWSIPEPTKVTPVGVTWRRHSACLAICSASVLCRSSKRCVTSPASPAPSRSIYSSGSLLPNRAGVRPWSGNDSRSAARALPRALGSSARGPAACSFIADTSDGPL